MEIPCAILGVSQNMDFEKNATVTSVTVRLPTGQLVQGVIDEASAASIIAAAQQFNGSVPEPQEISAVATMTRPSPPPVMMTDEQAASDDVRMFGGDVTLEEPHQSDAPPSLPPPEPTREAIPPPPITNPKAIARTVPRNEYGYPIAQTNGVDPDAHSPHDHSDGTESI